MLVNGDTGKGDYSPAWPPSGQSTLSNDLYFSKWTREEEGLFGRVKNRSNGGNCLVSWQRVQRPIQYGRLGIHDLSLMCWVLQGKKNRPNQTMHKGFQIQVHQDELCERDSNSVGWRPSNQGSIPHGDEFRG